MKITITIPKEQEQDLKNAFTLYSKLDEDQGKNLELNVLTFIQNIFVGVNVPIDTAKIEVVASGEKIKAKEDIKADANKLTIKTDK